MGQTTNQIEAYIENKREDLGSNPQELERKVKSATDWKQHFRTNPMTMMGVAFGGGVLLAAMLRGSKNRRGERRLSSHTAGSESHAGNGHLKHEALETWNNIKGALVGVAATRVKDFVGDVAPGFHEQMQRAEEKAKARQ